MTDQSARIRVGGDPGEAWVQIDGEALGPHYRHYFPSIETAQRALRDAADRLDLLHLSTNT